MTEENQSPILPSMDNPVEGDISEETTPEGTVPEETSTQAPVEKKRPERKVRQGIVISNKMQKTVVVRVDRSVRHPVYGRTVSRSRHFKVHDEQQCGIGDRVEIRETRPLSKEKRWRVARVLEKAK